MAWLIMSLRRNELQRSINDHTYEKLQISREIRQLSSFASAIGDGKIMPNEIASMGSQLFGDALDFMGFSRDAATAMAEEQTSLYETAYGDVTQDQLQKAGLALYTDGNGNLDTQALYEKFYDEALKEYAETVIKPLLNEKEKDLQDKQTELEVLVESEQAELEQLKGSISSEIQNNTIKLS